jgi:hypothetical protein
MHSFFQLLLLKLWLYEWHELEIFFDLANEIEYEEKLGVREYSEGRKQIAQKIDDG